MYGNGQISIYARETIFFVPYQSGFRIGRSTMDSILVLDLDIRRAIANKEVVISVFLKAYDTVWKEGLIIKLAYMMQG